MRKVVTLVAALMSGLGGMVRRQPTMPVPPAQVKGQRLVGNSLEITLPGGERTAVEGVLRLKGQLEIHAEGRQSEEELQRQRTLAKARKRRASKRKKNRGY